MTEPVDPVTAARAARALMERMRQDRDVRMAVLGVVRHHGATGIAELAREHPHVVVTIEESFREVDESVRDQTAYYESWDGTNAWYHEPDDAGHADVS